MDVEPVTACDHSPDELCEACRPSPVPDGRAALEAFKKLHNLKNDQHARALMAIEAFAPIPPKGAGDE